MRFFSLLLALLLTPSVSAQVFLEGLTSEQRSAYEQSRLFLESTAITRVSASGGVGVGVTSYSWIAYQGADRINEIDFYELTGRTDYAAKARARKNSGMTLAVLGTVATIAGTGAVLYGGLREREVVEPPFFSGDEPFVTTESDISIPLIGVGTLAILGGTAAWTVGLYKLGRQTVHTGIAKELVEEHNTRLIESLIHLNTEDDDSTFDT